MKRRDFLATAAATALVPRLLARADDQGGQAETCRTYGSVADAMAGPREHIAYVVGIYAGTGIAKPDYLATIDVDPNSPTYSRVIHRLEMPNVGDELHHYGWNACSSCHGAGPGRRYLIVPGVRSSRIHVIDTLDPRAPKLHKVIEPDEVKKTNLSTPHTVHCLADGTIMISMLGDAQGNAPGGFLLLDDKFDVVGRWEKPGSAMNFNYDFWYQPRHNVMISSEWGAPNTVVPGFKLEDVQAGKYGRHLQFWDWTNREITQTLDLGEQGLIPLEVRFHHNPESTHGFVGAALSTVLWHWHKGDTAWEAKPVVEVAPIETKGWPFPVPGLMTDLLLSLDDRWLYFSNWLHGDLRQYDVSDPTKPKLAGQVWLGGVLGIPSNTKHPTRGGPQMLQLSLDGKRLYVTNSLFSSWDDQFYPDIAGKGSTMMQIDCDTEKGGMKINEDFFIDFGAEPNGPSRAHEIRFPGGDVTSDIFV